MPHGANLICFGGTLKRMRQDENAQIIFQTILQSEKRIFHFF